MYWFKTSLLPPLLKAGHYVHVFCFFDSVGVGLEEDVYLESVANKAHHASAVYLFPVMDFVTRLLLLNIGRQQRLDIKFKIYHTNV